MFLSVHFCLFFFKQNTAYEMRISDWSSDVCSSDLLGAAAIRYLKDRSAATDIIGISRTPDTLKALGVQGRFGDYDDSASLASAYAGPDRLLIIPTVEDRKSVV